MLKTKEDVQQFIQYFENMDKELEVQQIFSLGVELNTQNHAKIIVFSLSYPSQDIVAYESSFLEVAQKIGVFLDEIICEQVRSKLSQIEEKLNIPALLLISYFKEQLNYSVYLGNDDNTIYDTSVFEKGETVINLLNALDALVELVNNGASSDDLYKYYNESHMRMYNERNQGC